MATPQTTTSEIRSTRVSYVPDVGPSPELRAEEAISRLVQRNVPHRILRGVQLRVGPGVEEQVVRQLEKELERSGVIVRREADGNLVESGSLSKLTQSTTSKDICAGLVELTKGRNGIDSVVISMPFGSRWSLEINPREPVSGQFGLVSASVSGSLKSSSEWLSHLSFLESNSSFLNGKDGVISQEQSSPVSPRAIERLKRVVGQGVLRLLIEKDSGEYSHFSLFPADIEKLREGGLRINGRVVTASVQRLFPTTTVESASEELACSGRFVQYHSNITTGSDLPPGTSQFSLECSGGQAFSESPGYSAYSIPILGLDGPDCKGLISHRPYAPIRKGSKVYSLDGVNNLSRAEEATLKAVGEGAARLESEFLIPKRALAQKIVIPPSSGNGPHVVPTVDPFSIRIEEDEFLRMTEDHARLVGQHEAAHLLDNLINFTERDESKFVSHFEKMSKCKPEVQRAYFENINESKMYLMIGGHSSDNAAEYFASIVNSVLHPKFGDIVRRAPSDFLVNYQEGLTALRDDFLAMGFDGSKVPFLRRLTASLQVISERLGRNGAMMSQSGS